jgi:hypothetical protein
MRRVLRLLSEAAQWISWWWSNARRDSDMSDSTAGERTWTARDLRARLALPVIGAPMFRVSNPALVIAQCTSGIVGAFPARGANGGER